MGSGILRVCWFLRANYCWVATALTQRIQLHRYSRLLLSPRDSILWSSPLGQARAPLGDCFGGEQLKAIHMLRSCRPGSPCLLPCQLLFASDLRTGSYQSRAASTVRPVSPGSALSAPLTQPIVHIYACPFVCTQACTHAHYPTSPPHVTSQLGLVLLVPTSLHLACEETTIHYKP